VLTKKELKDDAPFVLELPAKLNNRAPIKGGVGVTYCKDKFCLKGIVCTMDFNVGAV
jgi:hypothetical protein